MTHSKEMKWADAIRDVGNVARDTINAVNRAKESRDDWKEFEDGRSLAAITLQLAPTGLDNAEKEGKVQDIMDAHDALNQIHRCLNNLSVVTSDRISKLRRVREG